jgi:Holliday junction resolvasome RuvABC endonuclease subunit
VKILGIDPGSVSGALALLDTDDKLNTVVGDVPVVLNNVNPVALRNLIERLEPDHVCLEQVNAFPGQGATSGFNFGVGYGIIRGVVQGMKLPLDLIRPNVWKRHMKIPGGPAGKEIARGLAIRLHPEVAGLDRKKDHGRAEALLIAHWWARVHDKL